MSRYHECEKLIEEISGQVDDLLARAARAEAEVDRLRGLVEIAYCEGWEEGKTRQRCINASDWGDSDARHMMEVPTWKPQYQYRATADQGGEG